MKIKLIRIENFRCWKDQIIEVGPYNCFVGANGAGKSAVLCALNLFFRHSQYSPTNVVQLHEEDFYCKDTAQPIRITVTFDDLSPEAQAELKAYYRQGELTVQSVAMWDEKTKTASSHHYGNRKVMPAFFPYFTALDQAKPAAELKDIYKRLKAAHDLPAVTTKDDMRDALRAYEEARPDECDVAPSENQFYGFTKGANHLEKYIQWVYVPAVKDASSEQDETKNSAFGQLLDRTIRQEVNFEPLVAELKKGTGVQYKQLLDGNRAALDGISGRLQTRLQTWSSPRSAMKLDWVYDERSVTINLPSAHAQAGEDSFLGEVSRLGHGLQRSYLVALLQELAEQKGAESGPTLILGFEEPELYQHPPQAKYLRTVLEGLAANGSQVLITTHSPHMVSSEGFVTLRRVTKERGEHPESIVSHATVEDVAKKVAAALGENAPSISKTQADIEQLMEPSLSELYFCDLAILVEGPEDVAYLSAHLTLTGQLDWFRKCGCHFVICRGKTTISRPLAIAQSLKIPTFVIFDNDWTAKPEALKAAERDNRCLLTLTGMSGVDPMSKVTCIGERAAMLAPSMTEVLKTDYGAEEWARIGQEIRNQLKLTDGVGGKNSYLITHWMEAAFTAKGPAPTLEKVMAAVKTRATAARA